MKARNKKIMSAKICGNYVDYVEYTMRKKEEFGNLLDKNLIFLDSYDNAVHTSNARNHISIVSYSTQLVLKSTIDSGSSTAKSLDIFTMQQVAVDEKREFIYRIVRPI